jgi:hypothetical protein
MVRRIRDTSILILIETAFEKEGSNGNRRSWRDYLHPDPLQATSLARPASKYQLVEVCHVLDRFIS